MSTNFKPARWVSSISIAEVTETSLNYDSHSDLPLLSSYDRDELIARQNCLAQNEQRRLSEIVAQERKTYADSLVDQFELTGSNLPADANPRQLHLF